VYFTAVAAPIAAPASAHCQMRPYCQAIAIIASAIAAGASVTASFSANLP
jgi:hypothetical protein